MLETPCDLPGSAPPHVTGWILLEHPGPWGAERAASNDLIPADLRSAAGRRGLRVELIRRYRQRVAPRRPGCLLAAPGRPGVLEFRRIGPATIITDSILDTLAAGDAPGFGAPLAGPVYLVCTQGKIEPRCAANGRPVARALTAAVGTRAWESTHVGGCRFAANLVCLPTGTSYGNVTPAAVTEIIAATEYRRIAARWYRGRYGQPPAWQRAEIQLRRATGLYGVDDVRVISVDPDTAEVVAEISGGFQTHIL